jgi:hypothetical protein
MSNADRVKRVEPALQAYASAVGDFLDDANELDLIADLLHRVHANGQDPDKVLKSARMHFVAELHEEILNLAPAESDGECSFNANGVCTVCGLKDRRA